MRLFVWMVVACVVALLACGCSGAPKNHEQQDPSVVPKQQAATCQSFSAVVLGRAFQWHAGRPLPVSVSVDERFAIHLTYSGDSITPDVAAILASFPAPTWGAHFLEFPRLTSLDSATAEQLANWETSGTAFELHLVLPALRTVNDDVAQALSSWDGSSPSRFDDDGGDYQPESSIHLHLDAVDTLSAGAARWLLAAWPETHLHSLAHLYLPSLSSLQEDGYEFFEKPIGQLTLTLGASAYDAALASRFSRLSIRELRLNRMTNIGEAAAKRIATFAGEVLRFDSVVSLDAAAAAALATWSGELLSLRGLKTLELAAARKLVDWNRRDESREAAIATEIRAADKDDEDAPSTEYAPGTVEEQIRDAIARLYSRRLELFGLQPSADLAAAFKAWAGPVDVFSQRSVEANEPTLQDPLGAYGCDLGNVTPATITKIASRVSDAEEEASEENETVLAALAAYSPLPPIAILHPQPSVHELVALKVLTTDDPSSKSLSLDELDQVDTSIISAAARGEHVELRLPSITFLSVDGARAIAGWPGPRLALPGLKSLHTQAAPVLTQWKGDALLLNGLVELNDVVATVLAAWPGSKLELDGLRELHPDVAEALSRWTGTKLELDGIESIELATATALAKWKGNKLELDGLRTLDAPTAAELAKFRGRVELDGLRHLSPAALKSLIAGPAQILLDGRPISLNRSLAGAVVPDVADAHGARLLGIPSGSYVFSENQTLTSSGSVLPVQMARLIAQQTQFDRVDLGSVSKLSVGAAKALAKWQGQSLRLDGLTTLDASTARALATWKGDELSLRGLQSLSQETISALAAWKGYTLELSGIQQMNATTLSALTKRGQSIAVHARLVVPRAPRAPLSDVFTAPSFYVNEEPRHIIDLAAPR